MTPFHSIYKNDDFWEFVYLLYEFSNFSSFLLYLLHIF